VRGDQVLFVNHAADRSGPTRVLLPLLQRLRDSTDTTFEVAVQRGGELEPELRALSVATWELEGRDGVPVETRAARRAHRGLRRRWRDLGGFGLTYLNGAWTSRSLAYLPAPSGPVITHVHELDYGFSRTLPAPDRRRLLERTDLFIAGCEQVRGMLVEGHGVAPDAVVVHPYAVPELPPGDEVLADASRALRQRLGIPADGLVVGVVAVADWRKGPDLLAEVQWWVDRRATPGLPVHVVWVGGPGHGSPRALPIRATLDAMGLTGRFHVVGAQRDLWPWYRAFDLFALPSREDAFPLAVLEAAAVGLPVVTFAGGGAGDLVAPADGPPAGRVVPYPRVDLFADAVAELLADADLRHELGSRGRRRVLDWHTWDHVGPRLVAEIQRHVGR